MRLPLISSLVFYFGIFYSYAGYRIFILFGMVLAAGISEGFGISMALPLLNYDRGNGPPNNRFEQIVLGFLDSTGLGHSVSGILILMIVLFFLKALFVMMQKVINSHISSNLLKELRIIFARKYSEVKYDYLVGKSIGHFNNLITTETSSYIAGLNNYIRLVIVLIYVSIYIGSAFLFNWRITLTVMGVASVIFFMLRGVSHSLQRLSIQITQSNSEVQSLMIQALYNFKYLKATNTFAPILRRFNEKVKQYREYQFKGTVYNGTFESCMEPITVVLLAAFVWYSVSVSGRKIGEILVLLIFFYRAILNVLQFQGAWQAFSSSVGGILVVKDANKEMDRHLEPRGSMAFHGMKTGIELEHVNFFYNEKQVLFDIDLTIPKNRSIAIVGPSGAGKTTLIDILTALIVPRSGRVRIDGIDYRDIGLDDLRSRIGYVTQEPIIFNDTIFNNISLWKCALSDPLCQEEVETASRMANCMEFIEKCEKGLDTPIGEKGVRLSGGQRQRIAIAREIFKDPEIIIFDEATSSLDSESEAFIQESINAIKGKCTIVIIAHRLSTIKNCDRIHVLNEGRIVESGGFEELYEKKGQFFTMCQAQRLEIGDSVNHDRG